MWPFDSIPQIWPVTMRVHVFAMDVTGRNPEKHEFGISQNTRRMALNAIMTISAVDQPLRSSDAIADLNGGGST
jgi:hypothetical protein